MFPLGQFSLILLSALFLGVCTLLFVGLVKLDIVVQGLNKVHKIMFKMPGYHGLGTFPVTNTHRGVFSTYQTMFSPRQPMAILGRNGTS